MGTQPISWLPKFSINKYLLFFAITSIAGVSTILAKSNNNVLADNKSLHKSSQPRKEIISKSNPPSNTLIPMPLGDIDVASQKVESSRDPFQEPPIIETSQLGMLDTAITFHGIVKTGNNLAAMIKTEKGQKIYKVGDLLGSDFIIKNISETDVSVDISNGFKNYRLSLHSLNK